MGKYYIPDLNKVDYHDFVHTRKMFYELMDKAYSYQTKQQTLHNTLKQYNIKVTNPKAREEMQATLIDRLYHDEDGKFTAYAYQDAASGMLDIAHQLITKLRSQQTSVGTTPTPTMGGTYNIRKSPEEN